MNTMVSLKSNLADTFSELAAAVDPDRVLGKAPATL